MLSQISDFKNMSLNQINRLVPHITKIMGLALILYALLGAYSLYRYNGDSIPVMNILATYISVAMGTAILIDFSFNLNRAIGWYAMAIGASRALRFCNYLDPPRGIVFTFSVIMIILSINLCYTGLTFLRGSVRGHFMMFLNTSLMLLLNVAALLYYMNTEVMSFEQILVTFPDTIILIGMYIILLCLLSSKPVRMSSEAEKYNKLLNALKITFTSKKDTRISTKDADILSKGFEDRTGWMTVNDGGPVECEYKFKFIHSNDEYAHMTVQKWKDSDRLFFTMNSHDGESILHAYRFYADKILISTIDGLPYLVLFNSEGLYIRLLISDKGVGH